MANKYDDDYTRVSWENLPSHNTPINQQNLNKMDSQIKTLTTRVSDMSTYIPNVMYVDELPEQGVEGLLYVTALIEHGIELTGLPERYQSQSALDTWINQGNFAFMLHLSSVVTDDTYAIIENVLVSTVTSIPSEYTVSEMNGTVSVYYLYDPSTKTWESSTYGTLSVGDVIVGIGQVNINSKLPSHYYATGGDISDNLGIENIIGDMTISSHISTHAPTITYTDDDNTYEIYEAKPIQVLDPRNVYMWNDDTHSFFGFQKEYEAGQNITFTQQGTKVIISATGGDSYTEGTGINIENNEISIDTTAIQEKLIAGQNIRIIGNVISATGGGGGASAKLITLPIASSGNREGKIEYINTQYQTAQDFESIFNITIDELTEIMTSKSISDITLFANQTASGTYPTYFTVQNIQVSSSEGLWDNFTIYFSGTNETSVGEQLFMLYIGVFYSSDEISNIAVQIVPIMTFQKKMTAGDGISISSNGTISVNYPNGDTIAY